MKNAAVALGAAVLSGLACAAGDRAELCPLSEVRISPSSVFAPAVRAGVRYVDEEDHVHDVSAKVVVLSAGSNATARLLLTSTSRLFPNGAGNNNDVVGRNITSHAYVDARGFLDDDIYEEAGPGTGVAFMDYSHDNPGFVNGGVLCTDFQFTPAIFAASDFGHGRTGTAYR